MPLSLNCPSFTQSSSHKSENQIKSCYWLTKLVLNHLSMPQELKPTSYFQPVQRRVRCATFSTTNVLLHLLVSKSRCHKPRQWSQMHSKLATFTVSIGWGANYMPIITVTSLTYIQPCSAVMTDPKAAIPQVDFKFGLQMFHCEFFCAYYQFLLIAKIFLL